MQIAKCIHSIDKTEYKIVTNLPSAPLKSLKSSAREKRAVIPFMQRTASVIPAELRNMFVHSCSPWSTQVVPSKSPHPSLILLPLSHFWDETYTVNCLSHSVRMIMDTICTQFSHLAEETSYNYVNVRFICCNTATVLTNKSLESLTLVAIALLSPVKWTRVSDKNWLNTKH
jgi:hypothetical protein